MSEAMRSGVTINCFRCSAVGDSAADRFFATALSCGDDARARERQWRAARDAGPDVTAAAPDRREQRTTLAPAPTDKRLAPTVLGVRPVPPASLTTGLSM
jgi:hypothetical protein